MRWFTSDHHFGHQNIIKYCDRPFVDVGQMDRELVRRYQEVIRPEDDVFFVGDLVMGDFERGLERVAELPGNKILIPGNHDKVWPGGRKTWRNFLGAYEEVGVTVLTHQPGACVPIGIFDVCHFPPLPDQFERREGVDKFAAWRPTPTRPFIHGHIHTGYQIHPEHRWANVSVDVWDFYPVPEDQLAGLLAS